MYSNIKNTVVMDERKSIIPKILKITMKQNQLTNHVENSTFLIKPMERMTYPTIPQKNPNECTSDEYPTGNSTTHTNPIENTIAPSEAIMDERVKGLMTA
jgi:thymidylate synthase ThyX